MYLIYDGVRRAVAAREAGYKDILAKIIEAGKPDVLTRLTLDVLYSPKASIARDYRYIRDTEYPTQVLKTEPPPIEVEPLKTTQQGLFTPLSQVVLS